MGEEYYNEGGAAPHPAPAPVVLYAKLPDNAPRHYKILRFWDVMEPSDPTKWSWTKFGTAASTVFTIVGTATATIHTAIGNITNTHWTMLAGILGWHTVQHTAHGWKRYSDGKRNGT